MKKLFFVLSIFSISFLTGQDKEPRDPLIGSWISEDENTRGLTRCNISYENGTYVVELWGSCLPQDCYWGKTFSNAMKPNSKEIQVTWNQGFVDREQSIAIKNGKLFIATSSSYNDDRANRLDNEVFKRLK